MFERVMQTHNIDGGRWTHYLYSTPACMTGRAQLAFAALPTTDSCGLLSRPSIKDMISVRKHANVTYDRWFEEIDGETNREQAVRLLNLEKK